MRLYIIIQNYLYRVQPTPYPGLPVKTARRASLPTCLSTYIHGVHLPLQALPLYYQTSSQQQSLPTCLSTYIHGVHLPLQALPLYYQTSSQQQPQLLIQQGAGRKQASCSPKNRTGRAKR